jgi:hypothetical protein
LGNLVSNQRDDGSKKLQRQNDDGNDIHDELKPIDIGLPDNQVDEPNNYNNSHNKIQNKSD